MLSRALKYKARQKAGVDCVDMVIEGDGEGWWTAEDNIQSIFMNDGAIDYIYLERGRMKEIFSRLDCH